MERTKQIQKLLSNPIFISLFIFAISLIVTINRQMFLDEGLWSYIGRVWVENDMPPYKYTVENKNPAIFEVYALSHILFGVNYMFVRILGILSVIFTMNVLLKITRKLHSNTAGIIAMYIYGLSFTWHLLDGQWPSLTENFMCLFTSLSYYYILKSTTNKKPNLDIILSGVFIGIAIAFKQIAIVSLLGTIAFLIVFLPNKNRIKLIVKSGFFMFIGFAIASLAFLTPIFLSGVTLKEYFDGAWLILLNNGSYNNPIERLYTSLHFWLGSRIVIFYLIIPLLFFQKELFKRKYFIGLLLWFLFDFIGANSSGNLFGHQIKQIIPALSIITAILLTQLTFKLSTFHTVFKKNIAILLVSIIILFLPYNNLIINGYFKGFPQPEKEIGLWLKDNTTKEESVFVVAFGGSGPIMAYSERISVSKYFNITFLASDNEKSVLLKDIEVKKPKYIVINAGYGRRWMKENEEYFKCYSLQFRKGVYEVYLIKNEI